MRTPIVDGRSIDQFIPANLRDMFYRHPMPEYKYAIHDGYAPYSFSTKGLVLYLPLWALKGSPIKSVDAYKHTGTVTGALWGPDGRLFDGDDYIRVSAGTLLTGFGAMSVLAWINRSATDVDTHYIINGWPATGNLCWLFRINGNVLETFIKTNAGQFGPVTSATTINDGVHHLVGFTYNGATIRNYVDGNPDGSPVAGNGTILSNAIDIAIGARADSFVDKLSGSLSLLLVYNRALTSLEIQYNFLATKWRYQ